MTTISFKHFLTKLFGYTGEPFTDEDLPALTKVQGKLIVGKGNRGVTVVAVSDTHLIIPDNIPDGDVFIHCGDFLNYNAIEEDLKTFNEWLGTLPHQEKVVICGNHEILMKTWSPDQIRSALSNATHYLHGETVTLQCGLTVHGTPFTQARNLFYRANSFSLPQHMLEQEFSKIPDNIDILVSHVPSLGVQDLTHVDTRVGSSALLQNVLRSRPKLHLCGHNHDQCGPVYLEDILVVNVAQKESNLGAHVVTINLD